MLDRYSLLALSLGCCLVFESNSSVAARDCSLGERQQLLSPAQSEADMFNLTCSVTLTAADRVSKRIHIGPEGSGITLNCGGASLAFGGDVEQPGNRWRLQIRSSFDAGKRAGKKVSEVSVVDCKIIGGISIGINISIDSYRELSRSDDYFEIMSIVAPVKIEFDRVSISAPTLKGRPVTANLFYVSSGSRMVSFRSGRIEGAIDGGVPIYLDDSSSNNVVENSVISVATGRRELLAIDGSSGNLIAGNEFRNPRHGAIFLYRNCGENGIVRRGKPEGNRINRNRFVLDQGIENDAPAVWLASRERGVRFKSWCALDDGVPYGSGLDDADHAKRNQLKFNRFIGFHENKAIRLDDPDNEVAENSFLAN